MDKNYRIRPCFNRRNTATMEKSAKVEIEIFFSRTERKWIPTGIELYANQWDGEFVVKHANYKKLNKKITDLVKSYKNIIINLRRNGRDVNLANFNLELEKIKSDTKSSFIEFAFDMAQKRGLRYSTLRAHITTIEALKRSACIETFEDLTPENIRKFDAFLRAEDSTREQTTLHNYHKRIKPYINEAVRLWIHR